MLEEGFPGDAGERFAGKPGGTVAGRDDADDFHRGRVKAKGKRQKAKGHRQKDKAERRKADACFFAEVFYIDGAMKRTVIRGTNFS
jgi:hypothetical protein